MPCNNFSTSYFVSVKSKIQIKWAPLLSKANAKPVLYILYKGTLWYKTLPPSLSPLFWGRKCFFPLSWKGVAIKALHFDANVNPPPLPSHLTIEVTGSLNYQRNKHVVFKNLDLFPAFLFHFYQPLASLLHAYLPLLSGHFNNLHTTCPRGFELSTGQLE